MPTQTIKAEDRHKFLVRKNLESASLGSLVGMGGAGMAKTLGATISPKMIAALGVTGAITGLTASIIRSPEAPKDNVVLNKISREELTREVKRLLVERLGGD